MHQIYRRMDTDSVSRLTRAERSDLRQKIVESRKTGTSIMDLASQFKVPVLFVRRTLHKNSL